MNAQKSQWVDETRAQIYLVVEVRTRGPAGVPKISDDIPLRHMLAFFYRKTAQVRIAGGKAVTVLDRDGVAETWVIVYIDHLAVGGG